MKVVRFVLFSTVPAAMLAFACGGTGSLDDGADAAPIVDGGRADAFDSTVERDDADAGPPADLDSTISLDGDASVDAPGDAAPDAWDGDATADAAVDANPDAGPDAIAPNGDPLAPCIDAGYAMYVTAHDYAGLNGTYGVTGATGTWSAGLTSESTLDVKILTPQRWGITATSDFVHGSFLSAGMTYVSSPSSNIPYIQVSVDGGGCTALPQGSFTIEKLTDTGGDQASVNTLLVSFDVTCRDAGTLTGCVSYGN